MHEYDNHFKVIRLFVLQIEMDVNLAILFIVGLYLTIESVITLKAGEM